MAGEGQPISDLITPETLTKLRQIADKENLSVGTTPKEKPVPVRDRRYVQLSKDNPALGEKIFQILTELRDRNIPLPIFHITSRAVALDGTEKSTGFVESINDYGFRAGDTNVAVLVERGNSTKVATPDYFLANQQKLLREMAEIIHRFKHHGVRTNKASLREMRDRGEGVPVMLVIDPSGINLRRGTDYDNHYILENPTSAARIMGIIDLGRRNSSNVTDVRIVTGQVLDCMEQYLNRQTLAR